MDEGVPVVQRALGSAVVTGAAVASLGLSVGRPAVREGIRSACNSTSALRKSSARAVRDVRSVGLESSRPLLSAAIEVKDRARRRAVGMLPPGMGQVVENWRLDFIEAEKTAYYGGKQAYEDLEPRIDQACALGLDLVERMLDVFDDVVDASVAAAATVGEDMQHAAPRAKPKASAKKSATRRGKRA